MKLTQEKKRLTTTAAHLLTWGMLLVFPLLFSTSDDHNLPEYFVRTWLPIVLLAFMFYLNYFWLIDQLLFKDKLVMFLAANIVLALAFFYFNDMVTDVFRSQHRFRPPSNFPPMERRPKFSGRNILKFRTFLSFLLTAGTSVAIRVTQKWMDVETAKKNLENENLKAELTHLRYQVQPHFFFNSLNNIYSLVDSAPTKAKDSIHGLSKLMRHVLYEAKDEKILLSQEITFLKNFIKLMEIRLTNLVTVKASFPTSYPIQDIAPLLLVPLVENAFKHGVAAGEPTSISIMLVIEDGKLLFSTENTLLAKYNNDQSLSGIGLPNLKKRLELLYPARYEFENGIRDNMYYTKLKLEL